MGKLAKLREENVVVVNNSKAESELDINKAHQQNKPINTCVPVKNKVKYETASKKSEFCSFIVSLIQICDLFIVS